ncbi:MAG: hypothetical protein R3B91_01480 [Planctomycetaceae bacterium]
MDIHSLGGKSVNVEQATAAMGHTGCHCLLKHAQKGIPRFS